MRRPTARQLEVLHFVYLVLEEQGYPPTLREIAAAFDLSPHAAYCRLTALQLKGLVAWEPSRARTLHLTSAGYASVEPGQLTAALHLRPRRAP